MSSVDESAMVCRAVAGDRAALDTILESLREPLLRLATGMFWERADAEDATQEALIAVMTNLGTFRGEAALSTWAYRIAVRLYARRRRSVVEQAGWTWEAFAEDLDRGLSDHPPSGPDAELLAEEVRVGCTLAVLQCLERAERVVYLLGDVFEIPGTQAAEIVGISHDAYRQRLARVRDKVRTAVKRHCGIANPEANCRCVRQVERAVDTGRVDRDRLRFVRPEDLDRTVGRIQDLHDVAALFRATGRFTTPADARPAVAELLELATDSRLLD